MKRWAVVVAVLYVLIFSALTCVGFLVAFPWAKFGFEGIAGTFASWGYWVLLVLLALSQFALLAVPVRIAERRPVTRRALWPTVLAGGFAAGLLAIGAVFAIIALLFQDDLPGSGEDVTLRIAAAAGVVSWGVWALVFNRASARLGPEALLKKQRGGLVKGSVLELLIAVPTHIVARHRDNCCANMMTFIGLVFGFGVMLFAYGPAVFFLFAERWRQLHPGATAEPLRDGRT
ncbi:MAG TPA: hypothetical protein VIK52_05705 [Opitutaceae bacterium]